MAAKKNQKPMAPATRAVEWVFTIGYIGVIALFVCCGAVLLLLAAGEVWQAIVPAADATTRMRFNFVLESIGLLTIALVSLELGQTVFEEEVQRDVKVSGPTRVRRFLSRFMVVIVIALTTETLVSVFQTVEADATRLPYVAAIGITAAALLLAWGGFIRLNRSAEELEPEAMEQAKSEDRKVER
jgi:hypothetical protein